MSCLNSKYITIKSIFSFLLQKLQNTDGTSTEIIDQDKMKDMNEEGEMTEVCIDTQEPLFPYVNTTRDTEKEDADSKSSSNVLPDYFFTFLGICFYVAWAEVIVKAILLLIVFFAVFKSIQLCIKKSKLGVQFNITIR